MVIITYELHMNYETFIRKELAGRVEKVIISRIVSSNGAIGKFVDDEVYVAYGGAYQGKSCLIRFGLKQKRKTIVSNFLTSKFEEGVNYSLALDEYILLGLWTEDMKKQEAVPKMHEIEKYFDPGRKNWCYFLKNNSTNTKGRYNVTKYSKVRGDNHTINVIIRTYLPNPYNSCRLVIVEGIEQLNEIKEKIKNQNMVPIELERLVL